MKTRKIAIPALASALAIAAFAAMLAFAALDPRPAAADTVDCFQALTGGSEFKATTTNTRKGGIGAWTITAKTSANVSLKDVTLKFDGFNIANASADMDWAITIGNSVTTLDPTAPSDPNDSTSAKQIVFETGNKTVTVNEDIDANTQFTITATPKDPANPGGIVNPTDSGSMTVGISAANPSTSGDTCNDNWDSIDEEFDITPYLKVTNSPNTPGAAAEYLVKFEVGANLSTASADTITLHFDKDFGNLGTLAKENVKISTSATPGSDDWESPTSDIVRNVLTAPANRGHVEYVIAVPNDIGPRKVHVKVLDVAGLTNPTHAGNDYKVGYNTSETATTLETEPVYVPSLFSLDKTVGGRQETVTAAGQGFKSGTTATVFLDKNKNGQWDATDYNLKNGLLVGSDGTFTGSFTMMGSGYVPGVANKIGAIDGANTPSPTADFYLEPYLTVSPASVGHGGTLTITVGDWPTAAGAIDSVLIGGVEHAPAGGITLSNSRKTFTVRVKNAVRTGVMQLVVAGAVGNARESVTANVTVSKNVRSSVTVTPASARLGDALTINARQDWPAGATTIDRVTIGGVDHTPTGGVSVSNNAAQFTVTIKDAVGTGSKQVVVETATGAITERATATLTIAAQTPTAITLNDYDAARSRTVTVTGRGFTAGRTATVYLDANKNGTRDTGDTDLAANVAVGSNGTFSRSFTVNAPPFSPGPGNKIAALDNGSPAKSAAAVDFDLESVLTVTPASLGAGETLTLEVRDWPVGALSIDRVRIGGVDHTPTRGVVVSNNGARFTVTVKDAVNIGAQQVVVETATGTTTERATAGVTISGGSLTLQPSSVVPNQSVTITGQDFTPGGRIDLGGNAAARGKSVAKLGGRDVPSQNLNANNAVEIDANGDWSAALAVPVNSATVVSGSITLEITDAAGRKGAGTLSVKGRTLSVSPTESRVGADVTVTGRGFPASNNASVAVGAVEITYGARSGSVASVTPDANGSFTATFAVPPDAAIPSTNAVTAAFTHSGGTRTTATTQHKVSAGNLTLSATKVKAGETVTVTGRGFKGFMELTSITIGNLDATPSTKPITDKNGLFRASVVAPAKLSAGTHTLRVSMSGVTSSTTLTVVSGSSGGNTTATTGSRQTPAVAFAPLIKANNLNQVYHFDPARQRWSFYSPDPALASLVDLSVVEPGKHHFVQVKRKQTGVTLGGRTMTLYAGWNPMRW